jgi:SAM-dependent methyltransferase
LKSLPTQYQKFGIEPGREASRIAGTSGIKMLGASIADIPAEMQFDCITLIDVIEHLPEPGDMIEQALALLTPQGHLIVSTGNPEAVIWKSKFKSKFWYSSFAEHISFTSKQWLEQKASETGYEIGLYQSFSYGDFGLFKTIIKSILQNSYRIFPLFNYVCGWLILKQNRNPFSHKNLFLPCAGIYEDHHLVCMERHKN